MPGISRQFLAALGLAALAGGWAFHASLSDSLARGLDALSPAAGGDAPVEVALHKALYDLNMVSVESGAGIVGIKGMMFYEQDDVCDAWTTDQRFTMEYQYPERRPVNNTNHYVAWEAKDGSRFEFNSERQENGVQTELLRGSATRAKDGAGKADYTRPGDLKFDLPGGYLLPAAHTNEIIRRARNGEHFFHAVMFDGTDEDGPVEITAVIGKKVTPDELKDLTKGATRVEQSLLTPDAWHVRMAVFPLKDAEKITPAYEMDIVLHDNGVVSHALVDYKSFKVEQRLKTIERVPAPACP